jgi:hypothetical protein
MALDAPIERPPADAESARGGHAIAVHLTQNPVDVLALDPLKRRRLGDARRGRFGLRAAPINTRSAPDVKPCSVWCIRCTHSTKMAAVKYGMFSRRSRNSGSWTSKTLTTSSRAYPRDAGNKKRAVAAWTRIAVSPTRALPTVRSCDTRWAHCVHYRI